MDLQTTIYLVVGASFALYIGIAFWARAGSTSEFYVAGGGVGPKINGMATAADWMSAASFISMAGLISNMGYGGGLFLMGWTGGYVLLALLLAPYLRKFGKFTVPQFIGDRFYSKSASTVAVLCLLTASLTYVIGQMTGVGVAFSRFLGVSSETGIYVGMGIVFVYAVMGGMKGITYTQVAQYVVLIFAYTVPAVFISMQQQYGTGASQDVLLRRAARCRLPVRADHRSATRTLAHRGNDTARDGARCHRARANCLATQRRPGPPGPAAGRPCSSWQPARADRADRPARRRHAAGHGVHPVCLRRGGGQPADPPGDRPGRPRSRGSSSARCGCAQAQRLHRAAQCRPKQQIGGSIPATTQHRSVAGSNNPVVCPACVWHVPRCTPPTLNNS